MGRVDAEEAAAVGAKLLDGDLRRRRTERHRLRRYGCAVAVRRRLDERHFGRRSKRLHDSLRNQRHRQQHGERQQDIERAARNVDPEVADRLHRLSGHAARERDQYGHPRSGGEKVLYRQAQHLREIT